MPLTTPDQAESHDDRDSLFLSCPCAIYPPPEISSRRGKVSSSCRRWSRPLPRRLLARKQFLVRLLKKPLFVLVRRSSIVWGGLPHRQRPIGVTDGAVRRAGAHVVEAGDDHHIARASSPCR